MQTLADIIDAIIAGHGYAVHYTMVVSNWFGLNWNSHDVSMVYALIILFMISLSVSLIGRLFGFTSIIPSFSTGTSGGSSRRRIRNAYQSGNSVYVETTDGLGWSENGLLVSFSDNMVSIRYDNVQNTYNPQGYRISSSFID